MNKDTWNDTMIEAIGTLKVDKNGEIDLTAKKFKDTVKYTATLIVADDSPLNVLRRKNHWIYIDGLREDDKKALEALKKSGVIGAKTFWKVFGHLVRTPGKPGMNDLYNIKTTGLDLAKEGEVPKIDLEAALTKEEWHVVLNEKLGKSAKPAEAPSAPIAPTAPVV